MERIFLAAGGSGHRLDADVPKFLMNLPDDQRVGSRILKQLRAWVPEAPITICVGYRAKLMRSTFPGIDMVKTYDPEDPTGILCCVEKVLAEYYSETYTFILGDVIWHWEALLEAFQQRHRAPVTFYGARDKGPGETFMMTLRGRGAEIMRELLRRETFPGIKGIGDPSFIDVPLRGCKLLHLIDFMENRKVFSKDMLRTKRSYPVTDFDIDSQREKVWARYEEGEFN